MPADVTLALAAKNEASRPMLSMVLYYYRLFEWFGEILCLDDNSTDETGKVLGKYADRVIRTDQYPYPDGKRNFLQDEARYNWVFHNDADEYMDTAFLQRIQDWVKPDSTCRKENVVAFQFPRLNQHLVHPDYQIRLVDRRYVKWIKPPHIQAVLKSSGRLVDGPGSPFFQRLDGHPILHLPRNWAYDAEVQAQWRAMENANRSDVRFD